VSTGVDSGCGEGVGGGVGTGIGAGMGVSAGGWVQLIPTTRRISINPPTSNLLSMTLSSGKDSYLFTTLRIF